MNEQHYKILGISADCTLDEVKKAFRKKAKQFHPDLNKTQGAEEHFKRVNAAWEFLEKNHVRKRVQEPINPNVRAWRIYVIQRSEMFYANGHYNLSQKIPKILFEKGTLVYVFFAAGIFSSREIHITLKVEPGTVPGTVWRFIRAGQADLLITLKGF
jgi:hypothetical protein